MARHFPLHDPGNLHEVLDWFDSRFGPFASLNYERSGAPELPWWIYSCRMARSPLAGQANPDYGFVGGCSLDGSRALQGALGEAVERWSALNENFDDNLMKLVPKESGIAHLFPRCAEDEPCPESFRDLAKVEEKVTHLPMRYLADKTEIHVPASYTSLSHWCAKNEPEVTVRISTGLAFHTSLSAAIWSGLCEAAERDAFMLTWWTRRKVAEIVCEGDTIPESLSRRLSILGELGLVPRLFDITTDFHVPAVTAFLFGSEVPYMSVGASCAADPLTACMKALDEAVYVRPKSEHQDPERKIVSLDKFDWVQSLEDHCTLYSEWEKSPAVEFLLEKDRKLLPYSDFAQQNWWRQPDSFRGMVRLARRLEKELNLTVLWRDLTHPEFKSLGYVVKVLVPQMIPLSPDHRVRWLATPRLLHMAQQGTGKSKPEFNPFPHPFV